MAERLLLGTFPSRSSPGTYHEVWLGRDNVLYCTCYGWKRPPKNGGPRSCPHTRAVQAGVSRLQPAPTLPARSTPARTPARAAQHGRRQIRLDEEKA